MLTSLQTEYAWEIFETCRESQMLGKWAQGFLQDNQKRYAEDPEYFISPKMWSILNQTYAYVTREDYGKALVV